MREIRGHSLVSRKQDLTNNMLSKPTITELQTILEEEFDIECSFEDTSEVAAGLIQYMDTLKAIDTNKPKHAQNQS